MLRAQVVPTDQTRAASTWDHGVYSGYIDREKDRIYGRWVGAHNFRPPPLVSLLLKAKLAGCAAADLGMG